MTRTARPHLTKIAGAASALLLTAVLSSCGQSAAQDSTAPAAGAGERGVTDPDTLVIGHIPSEDSTNLDDDYDLLIKVLEDETGKQVEVTTATSYAAVIEAQRAGKVQIATYGPFSYTVAQDSDVGISLLGFAAETADDPGGYRSVASVPAESEITEISQLKDKAVCFVDPTSTSGYLFPSAALLDAGLDPEKDVEPVFAGGHDASVLATADGQCDAGFSTEQMATEQLIESGQLKKGATEVIWESDLIPPSPTAMSDSLAPELQKQLTDIYQNKLNVDWLQENGYCKADAESCGLPGEDDGAVWGYKPVEDSTYDPIRDVCATTESESCVSE